MSLPGEAPHTALGILIRKPLPHLKVECWILFFAIYEAHLSCRPLIASFPGSPFILFFYHCLDVDSTMKVKTFSENVPFLQMFLCVMPAMSLHITSFTSM